MIIDYMPLYITPGQGTPLGSFGVGGCLGTKSSGTIDSRTHDGQMQQLEACQKAVQRRYNFKVLQAMKLAVL